MTVDWTHFVAGVLPYAIFLMGKCSQLAAAYLDEKIARIKERTIKKYGEDVMDRVDDEQGEQK